MSKSSIQPALISGVVPDSIAAEVGFEPGDRLVSINGEVPRDLIDYRFLCADEVLTLEVLDAAGRPHQVEIEKDFDSELGLEFETALFDGLIQCNNHCPFVYRSKAARAAIQPLSQRRRLSPQLFVWQLFNPNQYPPP